MKKLMLTVTVMFFLAALTPTQAQDTTGRSQNKSGSTKKGKTQKKMKKNQRSTSDSTGTYGNTNRRRDSL